MGGRCVLSPILWEPQNAVDHDGIGDVFELLHADLADGEESDDTSCRLRANEDRSSLTQGGDPGCHIRDLPQGGVGPACTTGSLQFGGADQRQARIDAEVNSYGSYLRELCIELRCPVQQLDRRLHRSPGVALYIGISKNRHQPIASGLINVTLIGVNAVQETGEVALDNAIDLFVL